MKAGDGWWTNLDTEISFAHIRSTFKPDERSLEWKGRWESQHSHETVNTQDASTLPRFQNK